jgi:hypothetical protein
MKNHKRTVRTMTIVTFLVNLGWIMQAANAQGFIIDQSNTVGGSITSGILTPGQSLGQSFTPALAGLDRFEIKGSSKGVSTVQFNVFRGLPVSGAQIATGPTLRVTNTTLQTIGFEFPATVALVPGDIYTATLVLIAGDSYLLAFSSANPYVGGLAINEFGTSRSTIDWVFSEGIISIPEPSSVFLFGFAAVGLYLRRKLSRMTRSFSCRTSGQESRAPSKKILAVFRPFRSPCCGLSGERASRAHSLIWPLPD